MPSFALLAKVHRSDCPHVMRQIEVVEQMRAGVTEWDGSLMRLPAYVDRSAAEASRLPRCKTCCPDVSAPPPPRVVSWVKSSGLGWPMGDGTCARSDPTYCRAMNAVVRQQS